MVLWAYLAIIKSIVTQAKTALGLPQLLTLTDKDRSDDQTSIKEKLQIRRKKLGELAKLNYWHQGLPKSKQFELAIQDC